MYRVIIELKKDISEDVLKKLTEDINKAFDNRLGKFLDSDAASSFRFEFIGREEETLNCLQLGVFYLGENKLFMNNVGAWEWVDEEYESECCDLIDVYSQPIVW